MEEIEGVYEDFAAGERSGRKVAVQGWRSRGAQPSQRAFATLQPPRKVCEGVIVDGAAAVCIERRRIVSDDVL